MNSVNKTLYIPLYGKAYVSRKGLFLKDKKAEEIWDKEGFPLKGRSTSKWLAYYMGIRSAVFDEWTYEQLKDGGTAILHLGCGMDSRCQRVSHEGNKWYDIDFPEVITERKKYYGTSENYEMISTDIRDTGFLSLIPENNAVVIMEGVSMYLKPGELRSLINDLSKHFEKLSLLMDCYSSLAAKMSRYKNPINDVGVTTVYGMDDGRLLETKDLRLTTEPDMTPEKHIDELKGMEKAIFRKLYAGNFAEKLYRLYEYRKG